MQLFALGVSSGGVPSPGGAGSGYLLTEGTTRLLVDCGNGILGELARRCPLAAVSGVYLSHLHPDHVLDLVPLALFVRHRRRGLPIHGPPGTRTLLYRLLSLFHSDPDAYAESFEIREYAPWEVLTLGSLRLQACPVEHNLPSFALRAQPAAGGPRFVYSSDTKASALLVEAAQGADLLLAESTFLALSPGATPERSREHHMTAREAGEIARRAEAKRLVLTHFMYSIDPAAAIREASEAFGGPVEAARVGSEFVIP